jgi:hypothetical protein
MALKFSRMCIFYFCALFWAIKMRAKILMPFFVRLIEWKFENVAILQVPKRTENIFPSIHPHRSFAAEIPERENIVWDFSQFSILFIEKEKMREQRKN